MNIQTTYSAADAVEMLKAANVSLANELAHLTQAFADITDEIEQAGGDWFFSKEDFRRALEEEIKCCS